jgi:CBS domain-containing protein
MQATKTLEVRAMLAQDIMTRTVLTVRPDTKLADAVALLVEKQISGLPVVDEDNHLVGMLTEGDLLRRCEIGTEKQHSGWLTLLLGPGHLADEYVHAKGRVVRDVMTEEPISISEDTPLADLVTLMEKRHFKRVPVLRGDALVGLVSRSDLVRLLLQKLSAAHAAANFSDTDIRDAVAAELNQAQWANTHNISVSVRDGVVDLTGVLFNEAVRPALHVAAENTPGVKKVVDHLVWVEPVTGAALGS